MEENLIIPMIIEDKEELIDQLMDAYGLELLQLVYSYVKKKEVAEDLTQEIFVKCYQKLSQFNGRSSIKTWLWRIAINHCKDYLRSWHSQHIVIADETARRASSQKEDVERQVIQKSDDELLNQAVMNLPDVYREVIYLHYFEELTMKEIAQITTTNQNTIKTRMKRAKSLLKEELGG